jgi:hypothetical protein
MTPLAKPRGHSERQLYKVQTDRIWREVAVGLEDALLMHSAERLVRKGLAEEVKRTMKIAVFRSV